MMTFLKKIRNLALSILAMPFVVIIRVLSPLVVVRIGAWDIGRVGNILPNFDAYLSGRKTGGHNSRYFDICCFKVGKVANSQIKKMVKRAVRIWPLVHWVDKVNKRIPGWEKHVLPDASQIKGVFVSKSPAHMSFTAEEHRRGQEKLKELGIPDNNPFICFHAREASYLNTHLPQVDWEYHSYRNADINNYIPAVEEIAKRGYFAVRMGKYVAKELAVNNPKIIDYAANNRTDFLDVYLSAQCRFFVAGSDGLALIPTIFRRPVVWINYIPFSALSFYVRDQLFIPKKLWSSQKNRMLTFEEMLYTEVAQYHKTEDYRNAGIEIIDNSPEEIMDVTIEMEERLNKTWQESDEDKELQGKFRDIVNRNAEHKFHGTIGSKFLKQNKELLGLAGTESKNLYKSNV